MEIKLLLFIKYNPKTNLYGFKYLETASEIFKFTDADLEEYQRQKIIWEENREPEIQELMAAAKNKYTKIKISWLELSSLDSSILSKFGLYPYCLNEGLAELDDIELIEYDKWAEVFGEDSANSRILAQS